MQLKSAHWSRIAILGSIMLLLTDCALANPAMTNPLASELKDQRKLWHSQKINHYEYVYNWICFCPPPANTPTKVLVKNNAIISVKNPDSNQVIENPDLAAYKSIDQLFEVIEKAIERKADEIVVKYDPKFGYPTSISIDYIKLAADDEVAYSATDLVIVNP